MPQQRISWDHYALKLAEVAALRSEDPFTKVGACALNEFNKVIAVGYNGLASGKDVDPSFWEDREQRLPYMIHAEVNALSLCTNGQCHTLACTLMPCPACASTIAAYGIKKVIYSNVYNRSQEALKIFDFYNIEHCHILI